MKRTLAALAPLLLLAGCGGSGEVAAPQPVPTVTVTVTATATATATVTAEPEKVEAASLKASDFKIGVKILEKECFGSAGCNVSYRIDPSYTGDKDLPDDTIDVTYEISGAEDTIVGTFTIEDGQASYSRSESTSTTSSSSVLKAKATEVSVG